MIEWLLVPIFDSNLALISVVTGASRIGYPTFYPKNLGLTGADEMRRSPRQLGGLGLRRMADDEYGAGRVLYDVMADRAEQGTFEDA